MRHAGNAAVGFHRLHDLVQHLEGDGVAAFFIRRGALCAQFPQGLTLFGRHFTQSVAQVFVKGRSAALRLFCFRMSGVITLCRLLLIHQSLIQTAQVFFALDVGINAVQFGFGLIPFRALFFTPGVFPDGVMQGAHLGGDGVTALFQFMQFHISLLEIQ